MKIFENPEKIRKPNEIPDNLSGVPQLGLLNKPRPRMDFRGSGNPRSNVNRGRSSPFMFSS